MIKTVTLCCILLFPTFTITENRNPYKRFNPIKKEIKNIKASYYWPYTATAAERKLEGSKKDKFGKPIKTLQCNYKYVTAAVDIKIIPLKTYFRIKEIPGKLFYACDVGSKIKGKKIDIAIWDKKIASKLPKIATVQILNL